jgi:nucleoside 2-deoxyribosyltransferase
MNKAKQKLYLAGPMRGVKSYNFPAFNYTAKHLREKGYEVWNPAERDVNEDGFDPDVSKPRSIKEYMEHDLAAICRCDAVVVLDGWELSQGASLEVYVAQTLNIPIYDVHMKPVSSVPPSPVKTKTVLQEADELIHGDRNASYGPPNQDFQRTASMWTGLLQFKLKEGESIRSQDVAWMMMMLKASRAQHSDKRDHYVDAAGYAGCGWRCVDGK